MSSSISNNNNKKDGFFEISDDKISIINKASEYMTILGDFANWASDHFYGHNVEQSFLIYEDFVKSNEHIINKIKGLNNNRNV